MLAINVTEIALFAARIGLKPRYIMLKAAIMSPGKQKCKIS
jgi:hypothetical protein